MPYFARRDPARELVRFYIARHQDVPHELVMTPRYRPVEIVFSLGLSNR
jgi:hypothetical protein